MRHLALLLLICLAVACGGTTQASIHRTGGLRLNGKWVILPIENHSETPQAGERIEAMLDTLLRRDGITSLDKYPAQKEDDTHLLTSDRQRYESAFAWAKDAKFEYALTGSVEEWRYKSGIDGEPAIGVTLRVLEVPTGRVVWSATGSRTGTAGDNTSGAALKLLDALLAQDFRQQ
jgi:hypothetical protein